jgi:hypothetical protein
LKNPSLFREYRTVSKERADSLSQKGRFGSYYRDISPNYFEYKLLLDLEGLEACVEGDQAGHLHEDPVEMWKDVGASAGVVSGQVEDSVPRHPLQRRDESGRTQRRGNGSL